MGPKARCPLRTPPSLRNFTRASDRCSLATSACINLFREWRDSQGERGRHVGGHVVVRANNVALCRHVSFCNRAAGLQPLFVAYWLSV
jgi:hypothetical protein